MHDSFDAKKFCDLSLACDAYVGNGIKSKVAGSHPEYFVLFVRKKVARPLDHFTFSPTFVLQSKILIRVSVRRRIGHKKC
jgi:hypothetical protein